MCAKKYKKLISWYIDGEIILAQQREVEAHIATCTECKEYMEQLRKMKDMLSITAVATPRAGYEDRLKRLITKRFDTSAVARKGKRVPFQLFPHGIIAGATVCAAILFIYSKLLYIPQRSRITPQIVNKTDVAQINKQPVAVSTGKQEHVVYRVDTVAETLPVPTIPVNIANARKDTQKVTTSLRLQDNYNTGITTGIHTETVAVPLASEIEKKVSPSIPPDKMVEYAPIVRSLVDKGMGEQTAARTVKDAVTHGYNAEQLGCIVNTPAKNVDVKSALAKGKQQPQKFEYIETAPNPFTPNNDGVNDTAHFHYRGATTDADSVTPATTENKLRIYTIPGRLVRTANIFAGTVPAWDGTDDTSNLLDGGIYVFVLTVGENTVRGTVILAK